MRLLASLVLAIRWLAARLNDFSFQGMVKVGQAIVTWLAVAGTVVLTGEAQTVGLAQPSLPAIAADARPSQRRPANHELLAAGIAAFERGDAAAARELLERALAADPRSVDAHTYLGALADRANDLELAEQHFAIAARLAPRSASARNNYGAILLRRQRTVGAAAEFEASLRLDPRQANALINLAQIRFAGKTPEDLRAAENLFRRADAIAPDVSIARSLTVIALLRGDKTLAAEEYRAYSARTEGAAETTLSAGPRAELGGALLEAGLLTEAEAELKAALMIAPREVEIVLRLARVYLARQDLPAAGRTLETAVANNIEAAPIYALLAVVYEKSGHVENAIPAMRRAIELDPRTEKYRFQYGVILTNADAPAGAVIRLQEALQVFPQSARLWLGLGMAHLKLNRNDEAARALDRALELDPKLPQAYAYQGMMRITLGQADEGISFYEKALAIEPTLFIVHYLIADALLKKSDADLPRVEKHLRQAIRMEPAYAPSRVALAKVLFRANRLDEAAAELETVVKTNPELAETYYQLGRVYGRLKRATDAQNAMATFKRLSDSQKQQEQDAGRDIVRRLADVRF